MAMLPYILERYINMKSEDDKTINITFRLPKKELPMLNSTLKYYNIRMGTRYTRSKFICHCIREMCKDYNKAFSFEIKENVGDTGQEGV